MGRPNDPITRLKLPLGVLLALATTAIAYAAGPGTAGANDVSCCIAGTANVQKLQPTFSGDQFFFATESNDNPNVMVLLDNSTSMLEFQLDLAAYPNTSFVTSGGTTQVPSGLGATPKATSKTLVAAQSSPADLSTCHSNRFLETVGFSRSASYSPFDPAFPNHFDSTKYYRYMEWTASAPGGSASASPATAACNGMSSTAGSGTTFPSGSGVTMTERERCQMCLDEAGYYIRSTATNTSGGDGTVVFKGSFVNLFPPKFVIARKILTDFVKAQTATRVGVATYDPANLGCTGIAGSPCANDGAKLTVCNPDGGVPPASGGYSGMTPSCNQKNWTTTDTSAVVNAINAISFGDTSSPIGTPLAEALYNVGQWLTGDPNNTFYKNVSSTWVKASMTPPADGGTGYANRAVCTECQETSVVLITDGNPLGDNNLPKTAIRTKTGIDGGSPAGAVVCPDGGCGVDDVNGSENLLADVAKMLSSNDIYPDGGGVAGLAGTQIIHTYVVGLGLDVPLLKAAASAGKGLYFSPRNAAQLNTALAQIQFDVTNRATAFSSTAIQTLEVGTGSTAYVPRFIPLDDSAIWEGHLFRFDIFNEFVAQQDKDGDGTKDGVFLVDCGPSPCNPANQGDIIVENDQGTFVKKSNHSPAVPHWDAGDKLKRRLWSDRVVYTALPVMSGSNITGWTRTRLASDDATATALLPYLGILGNPSICNNIRVQVPTVGATDLACAKAIIDYTRGYDLFNKNPADTNHNRPAVLGDIFHSSPVVVDPPVDKFLCTAGFHSQCASTLYGYAAGPTEAPGTPTDLYTVSGVSGVDSYQKYLVDNQGRTKVVLVGANDFMLHAFNAGSPVSPRATDANLTDVLKYDRGTGDELWGFIPPDQLPRLHLVMLSAVHQMSIDGDIMVRDVWVDGSGATSTKDGRKQADEFHTIAVSSEREGGTHSFALDVTDPSDPQMKWMWPPPCTADELKWGQTWGQFTPKPPPIGPVLLQTAANAANRITRYSKDTEERWAVLLNGGQDPYNGRGRGVAMLDVWSGKPIFKAYFDPASTGPAKEMRYSFAATPAFFDYSHSGSANFDGFFDGAVVGDRGGQIWTFRFNEPGHFNSDPEPLVDNWGFGRAYEPTTSSTKLATDRIPIYTLPAIVAQDESGGYLRAYVGTGNRAFLRKDKGGECRSDDLATCVMSSCTVSAVTDIFNGTVQHKVKFSGSGGNFDLPSVPSSGVVDPSGSAAACTDNYAKVDISVSSCSGGVQSFTGSPTVNCTGSGAAYNCTTTGSLPSKSAFTTRNAAANAAGGSRFTNVAIFGPSVGSPARARVFDSMADATAAATTSASYDSGRVQLSELVNVTGTTATNTGVLGGTGNAATTASAGWTLNYVNVDERTATSPTVLGGCVLWSSVQPTGTGAAGGCASAGSVTSFTYQADFVTGAPTCADSFKGATNWARSISKNVISPPPEPAAAIEISSTGAIRYSLLNVQPTDTGSGAAGSGNAGCRDDDTVCRNSVRTSSDALQLMYSLPLSAEQHQCRHVDATTCE